MKITIEVNVPEGVDLDHAYQSVTDAMYLPQNVTQAEYTLVASMLNQLASKKSSLPKGFRDWAETHHEVVCTIYAMIDNDTMPVRLLDIIENDGLEGLYDLGIDLTNEFCNNYESRKVDKIIDFVKLKLQ
jgi:hypothetical protein